MPDDSGKPDGDESGSDDDDCHDDDEDGDGDEPGVGDVVPAIQKHDVLVPEIGAEADEAAPAVDTDPLVSDLSSLEVLMSLANKMRIPKVYFL